MMPKFKNENNTNYLKKEIGVRHYNTKLKQSRDTLTPTKKGMRLLRQAVDLEGCNNLLNITTWVEENVPYSVRESTRLDTTKPIMNGIKLIIVMEDNICK